MNALLLAASDAVSTHCNVASVASAAPTFARQQVAETLYFEFYSAGAVPREIFLRMSPSSLISVSVDGTDLDLASLLHEPSGVILLLPAATYRYWPAEKVIVATHDVGYVTPVQTDAGNPPTGPALPADLERAVIITAQHLYALQSREQFDVAANVEEDSDAGRIETRYFNAGRMGAVPDAAKALLAPYVRLV